MTLDERHTALIQQVEEYVLAVQNGDGLHDTQEPSLLILAVQPRKEGNNAYVRLAGNEQHLARMLAYMLADKRAGSFMAALADEMEKVDNTLAQRD